MKFLLLFLLFSLDAVIGYTKIQIDSNGYVVYCPCMGRFGNQAEQFLGTLQFAKHLDRTLVLPPFIQYSQNYDVNFIPFGDVINITRLEQYHRVIDMDTFIDELAPIVWPDNKRSIFCYSARKLDSTSDEGCNALEGSPFRNFWLHYHIDRFEGGSVFYSPFHTDYSFVDDWKKYSNYKVIAFVGAPSSFPTNKKAVQLQRFVYFSDVLRARAQVYSHKRGLLRNAYLSVHIRHGQDWTKACDLIQKNSDLKSLFSSQQCLGPFPELRVTHDLCLPTLDHIVTMVESNIVNHSGSETIGTIHIASDFENVTLWKQIHSRLSQQTTLVSSTHTIHPNGTITRHEPPSSPLVDLYLMAHANIFVGNCVSSFSAFVSRYRLYNLHLHSSTFFLAFEQPLKVSHYKHSEL